MDRRRAFWASVVLLAAAGLLPAQTVDWVTGISRNPWLDPRKFNWTARYSATAVGGYRWTGSLATAGAKTVTMYPCPEGVSGAGGRNLIVDSSGLSLTITAATNAKPIALTFSGSHGLSTGKMIYVTGVGGNTAANGYWTFTSTGAATGTLDGSWGNGTYTSGGTAQADEWVAITGGTCTSGATSGTLQFTTTNNHTGTVNLKSASSGMQEAIDSSASYAGAGLLVPAGVHDFAGPVYNDLCIPIKVENEAYGVARMMSRGHHGWVTGPTTFASACKVNMSGLQVNYHQSAVANATWTYKVVSGAVDNGSGLIRLTVASHGLTTGNWVHVSGVSGVPAATGRWKVTVIGGGGSTIDLAENEAGSPSAFAGSFVTGGNGLLRVLGGGWETGDYSLLYFRNISEGRVENVTSYGGYNGVGMFYVANTPTFTNVKSTADSKSFSITCGATADCQNQLIGHGLHARPQPGGVGFAIGPQITGFNCTNCWAENGAYNVRLTPNAAIAKQLNEIRFIGGFFDEATSYSVHVDDAPYYTNNDIQFTNLRIGTLQPLAGNFVLRACNGVQVSNNHIYSPGDAFTVEDCSNVSVKGNDILGYQPVEATVWTPRAFLLQGATNGPVTGLHVAGNRIEKHLYPTNFTNATPIVVTMPAGHGISNGERVVIGGVRGNKAANGVHYACNVASTTIQLYSDSGCSSAVAGSGSYTAQSGLVAAPLNATVAADSASHKGNSFVGNRMMGNLSWTLTANHLENQLWDNVDPSQGVMSTASAASITIQPNVSVVNITNAATAVTQMIGCFNGRRVHILASTTGLAFNTGGTAPGDIGANFTTGANNQLVVASCVAGKWYLQ